MPSEAAQASLRRSIYLCGLHQLVHVLRWLAVMCWLGGRVVASLWFEYTLSLHSGPGQFGANAAYRLREGGIYKIKGIGNQPSVPSCNRRVLWQRSKGQSLPEIEVHLHGCLLSSTSDSLRNTAALCLSTLS